MKSPLHYSRYAGFGQIIFVFCWWGSFPTSSRIMAFGAKKTSVLFNLQHCFSRMNVKQVNLYYDLGKLARDLTNRPISPRKVANWKGLRRYSCGNNYIQRISFHRALESIGSPFVDLTFHPKKIGRRRPSFFFPLPRCICLPFEVFWADNVDLPSNEWRLLGDLFVDTPGYHLCETQIQFSVGCSNQLQSTCCMSFVGLSPHPVTVTTRIITCLIGNPYKPSFVTVTGWGVDPSHLYVVFIGPEPFLNFGKLPFFEPTIHMSYVVSLTMDTTQKGPQGETEL